MTAAARSLCCLRLGCGRFCLNWGVETDANTLFTPSVNRMMSAGMLPAARTFFAMVVLFYMNPADVMKLEQEIIKCGK